MVAFSLVFWYLVGLCMCCGCVRADCCDVGSIGCSCIGVADLWLWMLVIWVLCVFVVITLWIWVEVVIC